MNKNSFALGYCIAGLLFAIVTHNLSVRPHEAPASVLSHKEYPRRIVTASTERNVGHAEPKTEAVTIANPKAGKFRGLNETVKTLNGTVPGFSAKYLRAFELNLSERYWLFFRERGLNETRQKLFVAAMLRWKAAEIDIRSATPLSSTSSMLGTASSLEKENLQLLDIELTDVLGLDGYIALDRFRQTATQRDLIDTIARVAFSAGTPISPSQYQFTLNQLIASEVEVTFRENNLQAPSPREKEQFFRKLEGELSPSQIRAVKDVLAQQDYALLQHQKSSGGRK